MLARAFVVVIAAVAAAGCADSVRSAASVATDRPAGVKETCATRSEAGFPGAFSDRDNLVVGPLVMIGAAAFTPPDVVREYGGNKFPLLVRAGHRVTVQITRPGPSKAALGYGPLPQGVIHVRDGHRVVTFVACRPDRDSGSDADGARVTFWSGFVLANSPDCVRLRVWIDDRRTPRKAAVPLGRRCGHIPRS